MASRTALVMANQGDPFIHGRIIGGLAKLGKKIFGFGKKKLAPVIGAAGQFGGSKTRRVLGGVAAAGAAGAAFAGGEALFDAAGNPVGVKRRRRARGITATELRGFKKVTNLLGRVGMVPRKTGTRRHSVAHA